MDYIKRDMEQLILSLSREYACILVSGPRQVGKTTMLEHIKPQGMSVVTLDDLSERQLARSDPETFFALHPLPVMIDEVQYAPELFARIKMMIDGGAPAGSFWLTGSQAFGLMRLAGESLAGRVALLHLTPLSQHEIYGKESAEPFDVSLDALKRRAAGRDVADITEVYTRIWNGSLPGHIGGRYTNRGVFYSGYLQTYIERDVRDEIPGADPVRFSDFIRAAACRAGGLLNVHAIATDVGVSDDTAKRWLGVLERSGVVFFLHPYSDNLLKRTVKAPKLYFFDTGLVCYLTRYSSPEILMNGAINGAVLENYVVAEIRKSFLNVGIDPPLYYYRDKDNREIDICIESDGVLHPVEIKRTATPSRSAVTSFGALHSASLPVGTGAVICTGEKLSALSADVLVVPAALL